MSGRHKVFLGMAAGVGKTYRMLQEGTAALEAGRDVVIGYLEPHGRVETEAQAAGLPLMARRRVRHRDVELQELDLPAILARHPELCLIDELAHTNAPGVEHGKRYEDVRDVLAAGIDVFSTVNVQHLESLNDQVAELTGVRVRETFPDSVLSEADEIVLVDLTPRGADRAAPGGQGVPGGASAGGAQRVLPGREPGGAARGRAAPGGGGRGGEATKGAWSRRERTAWPTGRLRRRSRSGCSCSRRPQPASQRVVRRAWRSAQRLGAELDILVVLPRRAVRRDESEQLDALHRLASLLGAQVIVEEDDDVAEAAAAHRPRPRHARTC